MSVFLARGRKLGAIANIFLQKIVIFSENVIFGLLLYESAARKPGWRFSGALHVRLHSEIKISVPFSSQLTYKTYLSFQYAT